MKRWLKRVVPFLLSFVLGISAASFYISNKTPVIMRQPLKVKTQSTFFNPPKPPSCENPFANLIKKRAEIMNWFLTNKDAPKKQKLAKEKELKELESQIEVLRILENLEKQIPPKRDM